ncbi:hypothetical protein [Neosynechococcus sphagnicola]|nr:hypothetical protein [Neosynechococcus sphagnicola]
MQSNPQTEVGHPNRTGGQWLGIGVGLGCMFVMPLVVTLVYPPCHCCSGQPAACTRSPDFSAGNSNFPQWSNLEGCLESVVIDENEHSPANWDQ